MDFFKVLKDPDINRAITFGFSFLKASVANCNPVTKLDVICFVTSGSTEDSASPAPIILLSAFLTGSRFNCSTAIFETSSFAASKLIAASNIPAFCNCANSCIVSSTASRLLDSSFRSSSATCCFCSSSVTTFFLIKVISFATISAP
ncbi:DUF1641 domain-containing protein [Bacillus sp. B-TM1]